MSRHYLNHRYSDDLDLFVSQDPQYQVHVRRILTALKRAPDFELDIGQIQIGRDFTRITLSRSDMKLQVDLINDIAVHYGRFEHNPLLGKVDGWENILSNKIGALFRFDAKDVADLLAMAQNFHFSWKDAMRQAMSKEAGVTPDVIAGILKSFPVSEFQHIKWKRPPDKNAGEHLERMADDILYMKRNTLCNSRVHEKGMEISSYDERGGEEGI